MRLPTIYIPWGGAMTIDCPYQPDGNLMGTISVRWSLLRGNIEIQNIMNNTIYSVNQDNSITIINFTPLLYGDYQCRFSYEVLVFGETISGVYTATIVPVSVAATSALLGNNYMYVFMATITNTTVSEEKLANLSCKVSVTSDETVGFMIDTNNVIDTSHSSCVDNFETATRMCNNSYNNYDTVLICDYSVSYEVDCTLRVNASANVLCMVNNNAQSAVGVIIGARVYNINFKGILYADCRSVFILNRTIDSFLWI